MTLNEILEPWILERWPTAYIHRSSWRDQADAWFSMRATKNVGNDPIWVVASITPIGIEYRIDPEISRAVDSRVCYSPGSRYSLMLGPDQSVGVWKGERLSLADPNYFLNLEERIKKAWVNTLKAMKSPSLKIYDEISGLEMNDLANNGT